MTTSTPDLVEVPPHLGPTGSSFYASAVDEFELSIPEQAALLQAAETLDTLRTIEDRIRLDGPITSTGRPSPLLAEARQQRATLVRLLGLLDLRLDADDEAPTSASRAARKAARARWDARKDR
jgi:hypothetical protein